MDRLNRIKISVVGEGAVGKTTLLSSLTRNIQQRNPQMTIGIDIHTIENTELNTGFCFYDFGGQDHFRFIQDAYIKGTACIIFVFAVDNYRTFLGIQNWIDLFKDFPNCPKFLIANKIDSKNRSISEDEAANYAIEHDMIYCEISAKESRGIEDFRMLLFDILDSCNNHNKSSLDNFQILKETLKEIYVSN